MNDNFIFPMACLAISLSVVLLAFGSHLENKRIYNNCLKVNGVMMHNDAVTKCAEVVK